MEHVEQIAMIGAVLVGFLGNAFWIGRRFGAIEAQLESVLWRLARLERAANGQT